MALAMVSFASTGEHAVEVLSMRDPGERHLPTEIRGELPAVMSSKLLTDRATSVIVVIVTNTNYIQFRRIP